MSSGSSHLIDLSLGGAKPPSSSLHKTTEPRGTGFSSNTMDYLKSLRQSTANLRTGGRSQATSNASPSQSSAAVKPSTAGSASASRPATSSATRKISPSITPLSSLLAAKIPPKKSSNQLKSVRKDSIPSSDSSLSSIIHVVRSLDELGISSEDELNHLHDVMADSVPESVASRTGQKSTELNEETDMRLPSAPSARLKMATERRDDHNRDIFRAKEDITQGGHTDAIVYGSDFDEDNGSSIATEVVSSMRDDDDSESSVPEEPVSSSSTSTQTDAAGPDESSSATSTSKSTLASSTLSTTQQYSNRAEKSNVNNQSNRASQTALFEVDGGDRRSVLPPPVLRQLALRFADDALNLNGPVNTALLSILDAQVAFIRNQAEHQWETLNCWNAQMEQQLGEFTSSTVLQTKLEILRTKHSPNV
uniref:Uncharacterized protein n=1 Tax=Plectus sambesii TaxID=2011161 RepID=A0A914UNN1_9BILA